MATRLDARRARFNAGHVRLVNAWWWARLKWRPVQHVVWGGRDFDWWVGSPEDLRHARQLKMLASNRLVMQRINQSLAPVLVAFGEFAEQMGKAAAQIAQAFGKMAPLLAEAGLAERQREYYEQKG